MQALLLATLSSDFQLKSVEKTDKPAIDRAADSENGNEPANIDVNTAPAVSDSITSTTQTQSSNNDETKKKQESSSHSDYDTLPTPQHVSRKFAFIKIVCSHLIT